MKQWLKDAVFYEIYPQSFYDTNGDGIGDLQGIIAKLDYIRDLGCNALWINPCFDSPFKDAGYDVRDYKKIAPRYGTNEDAAALFRAAHEKGIRVLFDLVPGHTSEEHPWFKASCKPGHNEYSDRFIWTDSCFASGDGMPFIGGETERNGTYILNFFKCQPALNYGYGKINQPWQKPTTDLACLATVEAMKDVMRFWLDMGCDGFRVDMASSLVKNDTKNKKYTCKIWRNIRDMLDRGPRFDGFHIFFQRMSVLFIVFFLFVVIKQYFLTPITPPYQELPFGAHNFVPMMTTASYIEFALNSHTSLTPLFCYIAEMIALGVPIGFFVRIYGAKLPFLLRLVIYAGIPVILELLQELTGRGWGDIDDVTMSLLGVLIGVILFYLLNGLSQSVSNREYMMSRSQTSNYFS